MKRKNLLLILGLGSLLFQAVWVQAGDRMASRRAMAFLLLGAGARASAMGEAYSGLVDDIAALSWNPAGLAKLADPQIMFMHNQWIANIKQEYLAVAYPLDFGCPAIQLGYLNSDSQLRRDEDGNLIGQGFQPYSLLGGLSFSRQLNFDLSAGINLNYAREQLDDVTYHTACLDLGGFYQPSHSWWSVGAAVQNLGLPVAGFPLPFTARLGTAAHFFAESLNFNLEVSRTIPGWFRYGGGAEFWYLNLFALRAGYVFRPEHEGLDALSGLRAGLGFNIQGYQLDYALIPQGDLGYGHRASFTYFFGGGRALASEKKALLTEARRRGEAALQAKKYSDAIDSFQKVLVFLPDDLSAQQGLKAAMEGFRLKEQQQELEGRFSQAAAYEQEGQFQDAIEEYQRILLIDENNQKAMAALARIQNTFHAQTIVKHLQAGREAYKRMLWADALLAWQAVLTIDPQHPEAKSMLEKTRAEMEKGSRSFKDPRIKEWYLEGLQRFEKEDYPAAIAIWSKVLKLEPNHKQTNKYILEAKRLLEQQINRLLLAGQKYLQAHDWVRAAASWWRILKLDPQHLQTKSLLKEQAENFRTQAKIVYLKGIQAYTLGKFKESIANWQDALTLVPDYPGAQDNIKKAKEKVQAIQ